VILVFGSVVKDMSWNSKEEIPFLVFQCIRFTFCKNDFTLTASVIEHFHTMDNKDGPKAYFS